jgi:ABC-type branched-subunit amino acid transport system ATPase component
MTAILHVKDVAKSFQGLRAVNNISLNAPAGRIQLHHRYRPPGSIGELS